MWSPCGHLENRIFFKVNVFVKQSFTLEALTLVKILLSGFTRQVQQHHLIIHKPEITAMDLTQHQQSKL